MNNEAFNDITDNTEYLINLFISFTRYAIKQKRIIIITLLLFVGIVVFFINQNDFYRVKASFIPPPTESVFSVETDLSWDDMTSSPISFSKGVSLFSGLKDPNDIYINLLSSDVIRRNIIKKFDLVNKFKMHDIDDTIDFIDKNTDFISDKGTIQISVNSFDPKLSTDIANEYIEQLSILLNKLNIETYKNERVFLEKRLNSVRNESDKLHKTLAKFQVKNKVVNINSQTNSLIDSISNLQSQIIYSQAELKALESSYARNSIQVTVLKNKISNLQNSLNNLINKNSSNNLSMGDIPSISENFLNISLQSKVNDQLVELVTKQYELLKVKESRQNILLKVVDKAVEPENKDYTNKIVNIVLSCILVITISILYLYIKYTLTKLGYLLYSKN